MGRVRRWSRSALALVVALLLAPSFPGGPMATRTAAAADVPPERRDRYGYNVSWAHQDASWLTALDLARQQGVGWIRFDCSWDDVQPTSADLWDWSHCDRLVGDIAAAGLNPVMITHYSTPWCTTAPLDQIPPEGHEWAKRYPPCDYARYEDFMAHMAARYGAANPLGFSEGGGTYAQNRVHHFEIGNEPNLRGQLILERVFPEEQAPSIYARILYHARQGIRKSDPSARILLGGLASNGKSTRFRPGFFRDLLADRSMPAPPWESFDIANFHTYGGEADAKAARDYLLRQLEWVGVSKPYWITETGYGSDHVLATQGMTPDIYGWDEQGQVDYVNDLLAYAISPEMGAERVLYAALLDRPKDRGEGCTLGLQYYRGYQCFVSGSPPPGTPLTTKRAFETYQTLISTPDTTLPSVSVTAPTGGAVVSGSVTLAASATDNRWVGRVEFWVDGTLLASDPGAPYEAVWTTTGLPAGSAHTIVARALDSSGNQRKSSPVSVVIQTAAARPAPQDTGIRAG